MRPHGAERVAARRRGPALAAQVAEPVGGGEVRRDDLEVAAVVGGQPPADGLGREAAVGERHHEATARPQHPRDLAEDLHRPHEVVHRDAAGDVVETGVGERQRGVDVEVVHDVLGQHRVGRELGGVHAQPDEAPGRRAEVRHPRRHQVEDLPLDGQLGVQVADRGDRALVDVGDQPWRPVERRVGPGVGAVEEPVREQGFRHGPTLRPRAQSSRSAARATCSISPPRPTGSPCSQA